jgi:hypothetical protein
MEWISVRDRLPEKDKDVLVSLHGKLYTGESYSMIWISNLTTLYGPGNCNEIEWTCKAANEEDVTHWMPLPEPPKD